jgi:hypothetical protein
MTCVSSLDQGHDLLPSHRRITLCDQLGLAVRRVVLHWRDLGSG